MIFRYLRQLLPLLWIMAIVISCGEVAAQLKSIPTRLSYSSDYSLQQSAEELEQKGITAFQQGRFADAARYFAAARRADPRNPVLAAALGQALMSAGDPARAVGPLRDALSAEPTNDAARLTLAQCYQRLNQDAKVLDLLKLPPANSSPSPLWLFTLAFSEFRMEQYQNAEAIFRRLVEYKPMEAAANFFVANCRFGQNDLEGSLPWYEAAIRKGDAPQNIALNAYYYDYGLALFRLGRYQDAGSAFLASATRDDRDPLPQYFLGRSQAERGETQNAISTLTHLIQDHPDFNPAYYQLGRLYSRGGDQVHAQEMFAKVKEIANAGVKEQRLLKGMETGTHDDPADPPRVASKQE